MNSKRNNLYLIIVSILLLFLIVGLNSYFEKVVFFGDFNIHLKTQIDCSRNAEFYAITPTGKRQPFYLKNNELYNLSGYYNAIFFSIDTTKIKNLNIKDSIIVENNDKVHIFLMGDVLQKWDTKLLDNKKIYALPIASQKNMSGSARLRRRQRRGF